MKSDVEKTVSDLLSPNIVNKQTNKPKKSKSRRTSLLIPMEYWEFIEKFQRDKMMQTGEPCTFISVVLKGLDILKKQSESQ